MTGKEIAANLRGTTLKWGRTYLHHINPRGEDQYCVLGIKAHERGISDETLHAIDHEPVVGADGEKFPYKPYHSDGKVRAALSELYNLNDQSESKEELIRKLEYPYNADRNFPVEEFIEYLKTK
jgi:hypothetical protein